MNTVQLDDIRFLSTESVESPHRLYELLREQAPIHWDASTDAFLVSRYEDVQKVLLDPETFSSAVGAISTPPPLEAITILASGLPPANTLITADPPEHLEYRKLVARAFTPRRVAKLRDDMVALAHQLVDDFARADEVEFVGAFAAPLPLAVIADQLGVPRDRIGDFKTWSDAFMDLIGGLASGDRWISCAEEILNCQRYFSARIEGMRDAPPDDMLGVLLSARFRGERPLHDAEIASILQQFMLAGNETSTAAIAATWQFLLEQPDVLEEVRADRSLVPSVCEEVFRLESPVQNMFRVTTRPTELAGVEIPAFKRIGIMFGSANRDPRVFPEPERLNPHRENVRDHLAFGQGNHYCVGAGLARLEACVALETLLDRFEAVRFAPGRNDFRHNPMFIARGLCELWLEFDAC